MWAQRSAGCSRHYAARVTFHHLRAATTSLIVETTLGVPTVLYWGAPLASATLTDESIRAIFDEPIPEAGLDVRPPLSLLPEHGSGYLGRPGLSGRRSDGSGWAPRFTAVSTDASADRIVHVGEDQIAGLSVNSIIELTASGVVRVQTTITNTGTSTYEVDAVLLTLPLAAEARELLTLEGRWTNEFQIVRRDWGSGSQSVENRKGRTSHDRTPYLVAGTPRFTEATGCVWGIHVGWSGNTAIHADANDARRSISAGELLLSGEVVLQPGTSYESPWVYGAFSDAGLTPMSQSFHQYLRARTNHPQGDRPVVLNTWEAVYFDHDLDTLKGLADRAADVGVERFVLDDGWFGGRRNDRAGLGDWWVSAEAWPTGLTPLIDHVRSKGMEFGIWVEPEMVNPDSDLYRAHPEWVLEDHAYPHVTGRHQLVLNVGLPEVRDYLFGHLDALLRDHDIAYVKWDMNRDLVHASTNGRASVHAQTLGVYELFDRITSAHPDVEFESCSSGGARIDFKVLDYTKRFWTSDSNDAHDRQNIQRGFSLFMPPELMGSHVGPSPSHTTMRQLSLAIRGITSMFGHFGTEWNLLKVPDDDLARLATWIARYKRFRGLLHTGSAVRIDVPSGTGLAHGVVATDQREALYAYVQMQASLTLVPDRLKLVGLDPTLTYRVAVEAGGDYRFGPSRRQPAWTKTGLTASGDVLATIGINPPSLDPDAAVLVHVEAV